MDDVLGVTLCMVQMMRRRQTGYRVFPAKAKKLMLIMGQMAVLNEIIESGVKVNPKLSTMVCAE